LPVINVSGVLRAQKNHGSSFDDDKTSQDKFVEHTNFNNDEKLQPQPPPLPLPPAISSRENFGPQQQHIDSSFPANNFQLLPPMESQPVTFVDRSQQQLTNQQNFPPAPASSVAKNQQLQKSTLFKSEKSSKNVNNDRLQTKSSAEHMEPSSSSQLEGPELLQPEVQQPAKMPTKPRKMPKPSSNKEEQQPAGPQEQFLQVEPPVAPPMPSKNKIGGNLNIDSGHFPALPKIADLGPQHGHDFQVEQIQIEDQIPVDMMTNKTIMLPVNRKVPAPPNHPPKVDVDEHEDPQHNPFDANKFANLVNEKFSYIIKNLSESGYLSVMDIADENVIKNISNSFAEYVEKTLKFHPVNAAPGGDQEQILDIGAGHVITDFKNRLAIPIFGPPGHTNGNGEIVEAKPAPISRPVDKSTGKSIGTADRNFVVHEKLDKTNLSPKLSLEKPTTLPAFGGMATKVFQPPAEQNQEDEEEHLVPIPPQPDKTKNMFISGQQGGSKPVIPVQKTRSRPSVAGAEEIPVDESGNGPQPPVVFGGLPFNLANRTRPIQIPENSRFFGAVTETEPTVNPPKIGGSEEPNKDQSGEIIPPKSKPEFAAEQHETEEVVQKATTPLVLVKIPVQNATAFVVPDIPKIQFGERPTFPVPRINNVDSTMVTEEVPDLLRFVNGSFANVPPLRMPPNKAIGTTSETALPPGTKPDLEQVATSRSSSGFNRSIIQPSSGESTSSLESDNITTSQVNLSEVTTFPTPPNWNFTDTIETTSTGVTSFGESSAATLIFSKETWNVSSSEFLSTATESTGSGNSTESIDNSSALLNNVSSTHPAFILGETEEVTNFTAEHITGSISSSTTEPSLLENATGILGNVSTETDNSSLTTSIFGTETSIETTTGTIFISTTSIDNISETSNLTTPPPNTDFPPISNETVSSSSVVSETKSSTEPTPTMVFNFTTFNGNTSDGTEPNNVTLVSMVLLTSTEKPAEGVASWKLKLTSIEFDTGLNDKNSWQYKNLYETIYPEVS